MRVYELMVGRWDEIEVEDEVVDLNGDDGLFNTHQFLLFNIYASHQHSVWKLSRSVSLISQLYTFPILIDGIRTCFFFHLSLNLHLIIINFIHQLRFRARPSQKFHLSSHHSSSSGWIVLLGLHTNIIIKKLN